MRDSSRRVCSSSLTSSQYLMRITPESTLPFPTRGTAFRKFLPSSSVQKPILDEDHARVDDRFLDEGHGFQEVLSLLLGAEAQHPLHAGAVIPAAVKDHHFARRRQVRQIALDVHLALLAFGRRGQRDYAEHARAHALGDRLDAAALAGAVAALEDDADLEPLVLHPFLQLDELDMELLERLVVVLALQRLLGLRFAKARAAVTLLLRIHGFTPLQPTLSVCAAPRGNDIGLWSYYFREQSHICGEIDAMGARRAL